MTKRVFLSPPETGSAERAFVADAFDSGWIAPLGPHVDSFEAELAACCGVSDAAALTSGTAALHLALLLAGVCIGDRVICPTLTFVASVNPIRYVGAEPVLIDCNLTGTIDADLLESELKASAKSGNLPNALITVDLYGQCPDYQRIEALCNEYDVPLIEDAAEALGSTAFGQPAGSFGSYAVLSFNGNKIITTSGGGALLSNDPKTIERARFLASQARDPAPHYQHSEIGYNYRLSNVLAAIGRGQLLSLTERVAAKRAHFVSYEEALGGLPGIEFMPEASHCASNRWLTTLTVEKELFGVGREDIRLALEENNIESRPIWKPMHLQPVFGEARLVGGGVAQRIFDLGLCLPSGSSLSSVDRDRVIDIVSSLHQG